MAKTSNTRIQRVEALWDALVERSGLDIEDIAYDAALVAEIAELLTISDENFRKQLIEREVSVERLLQAFLQCAGPFAVMMTELLAFFARAGARATANNLKIEFNFDKREPALQFDLENFREWEKRWRRATMGLTFDRLDLVANRLKDLFMKEGVTYRMPSGDFEHLTPAEPEVARWLNPDLTDEELLGSLPPPPAAASVEVAEFLKRIWAFLYACLTPSLWAGDRPLTSLDVMIVVRGAFLMKENLEDLLPDLRNLFRDTTQDTVEISIPVQELLEIFSLPIWQRRSEVYAVWVGAKLIEVFGEDARVHTVNQTLVFSFGGTHLATVRLTDGTHLTIWCEVRTHAKNLLGKGRKNAIQPDFVVLREPISDPASTALVLECKQYKKQNTREFAAAIVDYARTHTNAHVILVNYGAITEAVEAAVKAIDPSIASRTEPLGNFRPHSDAAKNVFDRAVQKLIPPKFSTPATPSEQASPPPIQSTSASSGSVVLSWQGDVDLDIQCWIVAPEGNEHVYFKQLEWSRGLQRVWLDRDLRQGGGSETLNWENLHGARLDIAINAYGNGATVQLASEVLASICLGDFKLSLKPPPAGSGAWWNLFSLGPDPASLEVWNAVENAPLGSH
jgi:hypothetical protein